MKAEQVLYKKGFRITEAGNIVNPKGLIIKGYMNGGYLRIGFRHDGKVCKCSVSRLQAFQKYGLLIYGDNIEVRHLDGIKTNNSYENIAIGTVSQNQMDIPEAIRIARSVYAASFLRKHDKEAVKAFYVLNGKSYKKTMDKFGISSKGTLHHILNK